MKIAYIANARIPTEKAHGTQIMNMCAAFAATGNDVTLIVPERDNPIRQDPFGFYHLPKNFEIQKIGGFDFFNIEKHIGRLSFYLQSFSFLLKLKSVPIEKSILIYTRNPEIAWFFARRGYKVAYECHDWFKKNKRIALFFLRHVRHIITTNEFIKEEFVQNGFSSSKLFVAPNGVDLSVFDIDTSKDAAIDKLSSPDEMKKALHDKKVLLYTGSFLTMGVEKGIADILKALKELKRNDIVFVAVGGAPQEIAAYQKMSAEYSIGEQTYFLPRTDQANLAVFQKAADILLMPFPKLAHYEYHMTPLKMFEYMASGRPIIASSLPSIKQILNEKNCLFCEPDNPLDLARKITYLVEHPEEAAKRAAQAKQDVQGYSWDNRAKKIMGEIQKKMIAVIPPHDRDGLTSTVLDGLLQLQKQGELRFVLPWSYTDPDLSLKDFIVSQNDFVEIAKDASLIFLIKGKKFNTSLARRVGAWDKTIFIDGTEVGGNNRYDMEIQRHMMDDQYTGPGAVDTEMLTLCKAYFRRERPYIKGIRPLPFGIESKFNQYDMEKPEKTIDFCCVFGQDEYPLLRRHVREALVEFCKKNNFICHTEKTKNSAEFYGILAKSKVGISVGGGGFDTFRFWEILANNCLLMTEKIAVYEPGDGRLDYGRIWQFDDLNDFNIQLEKVGTFLREKYRQGELEQEYRKILNDHSSVARVKEILSL